MPEGRTRRLGGDRRARAARIAGLYAITPDMADTALLARKVAAALDGGATVIQYRNKSAGAAQRAEQARTLARLCAMRKVLFIVNDDADVAAGVDADGVHLGADDPAIDVARQHAGPDRLIGVSCYGSLDRARAACAAGADYVAFGGFFTSTTKPAAVRADLELLQRARMLGIPVVAIGGITSSNASALIDAGATAVAVVADVFAHDDPAAITRAAAGIVARFAPRRSNATASGEATHEP